MQARCVRAQVLNKSNALVSPSDAGTHHEIARCSFILLNRLSAIRTASDEVALPAKTGDR